MRLDKYLKTARILKRRTVSKELADQERVYVNGKIAKPSTDVKIGDTIKVIFGYRELTVRVTMIQKQANKNDASLMFEVIEEKLIKKRRRKRYSGRAVMPEYFFVFLIRSIRPVSYIDCNEIEIRRNLVWKITLAIRFVLKRIHIIT